MYNKKIPVDLNCGFRIALEVMAVSESPISFMSCWTIRAVRAN